MQKVPYEIHITVHSDNVETFKQDCTKLNVKPVVIDLQNQSGKNVMHDFMTSSAHSGDDASAFEETKRLKQELKNLGYNVVRSKIESVPWHPNAPKNKEDMPANCYFESHLAVLTQDTPERMDLLSNLAKQHGCHRSRNIFKKLETESVIMMTLRNCNGNSIEFSNRVEFLKRVILENGFSINKTEIEFCVFDSNVHHDREWIEA